jgi:hypothetical protein
LISHKVDRIEPFLRYVEEELMIGGGRWIATFNIAIRDFNIAKTMPKKKGVIQSNDFNSLIYGGVRHSGFIISKAYAFIASPTYRVGCATIVLDNPNNAKWSSIVNWLRDINTIKQEMEFEWIWLLLFGFGSLPTKITHRIRSHVSKEIGLLYADLKNTEIHNSDGFIARHGAKLFHPKNLHKKKSRIQFWKK